MTLRPSSVAKVALALVGSVGLLVLVGCLPGAGVCRSSQECQPSEICVESHCHLTCNATPDCPPANVCRNGICFAASASDAAIADGAAVDAVVDALHPDTVHADTVHADTVRADSARADALHADTTWPDAVRADAVAPDAPDARDGAVTDAWRPEAAADSAASDRRDAGAGTDHVLAVDGGIIPFDAATPVDATTPVDSATPVDAAGRERADAGAPCPGTPLAALCPAGNADLVACFTFDNDNGATAPARVVDSSAYLNHGTIEALAHEPGVAGLALTLDGTNAVSVPSSDSLNTTSAFTLEAWVWLDQLPLPGGRVGVIDKNAQYGLFVYASGQARCTASSTSITLYGGSVVAGSWTHLACAYAPALGIYRMYQDGVEVAQLATTLAIPGTAEVLAIGGNSPSGEVMSGALDSVRIWRTVRSAADICWAAQR